MLAAEREMRYEAIRAAGWPLPDYSDDEDACEAERSASDSSDDDESSYASTVRSDDYYGAPVGG